MRIKKLPSFLANQIAAGEVVERPASVLKEILENSIDAGSKFIEIEIKNGGINYIRVTDDGAGIYKDDLQLACTQHATSKITKQEDLEGIVTLGFRGEALASIASVSKFEITSKPETQKNAWKIKIDNKIGDVIEPASHCNGTTVIMRDLFYNTPARRNFLRTAKTEYFHIEELFKRVALSNFDVGFAFICDGKQIYKLAPAVNKEAKLKRVAKVLGNAFLKNSIEINFADKGLSISGWFLKPESSKAQAMSQYFYLNNRIIKDRVINHAIKQCYQEYAELGKSANYCLYLSIEPKEFDINVHPTKQEVRFKNSRIIHNFILDALTSSFDGSVENKEVDDEQKEEIYFNKSMNFELQDTLSDKNLSENKQENLYANSSLLTTVSKIVEDNKSSNLNKDFNQNTENPILKENIFGKNDTFKVFDNNHFNNLHKDSDENKELCFEKDISDKLSLDLKILYILENKIALIETDNKLASVNLKDLLKVFLETEFKKELENTDKISASTLIIPQTININISKVGYDLLEEGDSFFSKLGFDLELTHNNGIIVRALPKILIKLDVSLTELLQYLLEKLNKNNSLSEKADTLVCFCSRNNNFTKDLIKNLLRNVQDYGMQKDIKLFKFLSAYDFL